MVGLPSAPTKAQAYLTCTKRTKTWRRIEKREFRLKKGEAFGDSLLVGVGMNN